MRKFILHHIPGQLSEVIMANVDYHWQLIPKSDPTTKNVLGGGLWHLDPQKQFIYFWHNSLDFGPVTPEALANAIKHGGLSMRWFEFDVYYSPEITPEWNLVSKWTQIKI